MEHLPNEKLIEILEERLGVYRKFDNDFESMSKRLKEVNQKLIESETMKSNFISNIRNEINNPLSAILGMTETIMYSDSFDAALTKQLLKTIHDEAFNLDFQLKIIFAAADIEAGETNVQISRVNINKMIIDLIEAFQNNTAQKVVNIDFKSELKEGSCFNSDVQKLHLIVSNLISNAVEYGSGGGRVEVRTWIDGESLHIAVQDFGIGIDKSDQDRIFDRFVQLDSGLTKKYKGHGLGLSVTKDIVEVLGGVITVDSDKGKGSTFTAALPEMAPIDEMTFQTADGTEEIF